MADAEKARSGNEGACGHASGCILRWGLLSFLLTGLVLIELRLVACAVLAIVAACIVFSVEKLGALRPPTANTVRRAILPLALVSCGLWKIHDDYLEREFVVSKGILDHAHRLGRLCFFR